MARVTLPPLFSEHAVLQRSDRVPVWGKAEPGERVKVSLGAASATVEATADGKWRAWLDLASAPTGAGELIVEGQNRLVIADVVVGEVWLCAGQSNMEWALAATTGVAPELARPANPQLRQFLARRTGPARPAESLEGRWAVAAPETAGKFSAVGYHFGRRIVEETNAFVGLINVGAGGTPIEGWMSAESLARDGAWQATVSAAARQEEQFPALLRDYVDRMETWFAQHRRRDRPTADVGVFAAPGASLTGWRRVEIPESLAGRGWPEAGAIWLRRTVHVPEIEAIGLERGFQLSLGVIRGADTVYWNGIKIGGTDFSSPGVTRLRRYIVPPALLQRGSEATLAIRIFHPLGGMSLTVPRDPPLVANTVPIDGAWWARTEFAFEEAETDARTPMPLPPARPRGPAAGQFNGLIAPLAPYALRGAIWYQGESNAPRAAFYRDSFALMLADWRALWGRGDFPFYHAQLANFDAKDVRPRESDWAELREAQTQTLSLPNTGQAVTIDLGEELEVHPRNKRDVGERLALLALARTYGRALVDSGPRFVSAANEGSKIRIRFRDTTGGLVARPLPTTYAPTSTRPERIKPLVRHSPAGELEGFAICGEDRRWHWARAVVEHDTVVVSALDVPRPVAVRYAWASNPTCSLYNGAGLPAAPFRTDDFPLNTTKDVPAPP
ncbi:MAG: acetyl esterase [Opitutus sp.]|nr:acetyl esterase [Opitutus sp.]